MAKRVPLREKVKSITEGTEYPEWMDKRARPYFDALKKLVAAAGNDVKIFSQALGILAENFEMRQRMKAEINDAPCIGTIAASSTSPGNMGKRGNPTLRAYLEINNAIIQLLKEFYLTPRSMNTAGDRCKKSLAEEDPFTIFTNPEDLNKFVEVSSEITQ